MNRLAVTGGGTGGHIFPALAMAQAFLTAGDGREVLYLGRAGSLEEKAALSAGLPFGRLRARGFRGKSNLERVRFLGDLLAGTLSALRRLRAFSPDAVLATGSYVSLPVLIAARLLRLPYFLQEQNSVPGAVIRHFAANAQAVYLGFAEAEGRLPQETRCILSGNPLRADFTKLSAARRLPDYRSGKPRLLVFGGSGGASSLNRAVAEALPALARDFQFEALVQTGDRDFDSVKGDLAALSDSVRVLPYIERMPEEMAAVDWAVCRAGAMTLAELVAMGLPAILVPFPHAVDDHQTQNAQAAVDAGAAVLLPDARLDGQTLAAQLAMLWRDPERGAEMAAAMKALGRPDAAAMIVSDMEKHRRD